jgi:hypothetical protein
MLERGRDTVQAARRTQADALDAMLHEVAPLLPKVVAAMVHDFALDSLWDTVQECDVGEMRRSG